MNAADQIARLFSRQKSCLDCGSNDCPECNPSGEPSPPSCAICGDRRPPHLYTLELHTFELRPGVRPRAGEVLATAIATLPRRFCPDCLGFVVDHITTLRAGFAERRCIACGCHGDGCDAHRARGSACCGSCAHYEGPR